MLTNDELYSMIKGISTFDRDMVLSNLLKKGYVSLDQYRLLRNSRREFKDKVI